MGASDSSYLSHYFIFWLTIHFTSTMLRFAVFSALLCLAFGQEVKNCMKDSVLQVSKVEISPHPIPIEKGFHINYDATVVREIDGEVDVDVTIKKKLGFLWVTVPCVMEAGSCTYEDICAQMDDNIDSDICDILTNFGIPCGCPFEASTFKNSVDVPAFEIPGVAAALVSGTYHIKAEIKQGRKMIGCIEAEADIEFLKVE